MGFEALSLSILPVSTLIVKVTEWSGIVEVVMNMEAKDSWDEADLDEVLQYLKSSKHLCLPDELKPLLVGL